MAVMGVLEGSQTPAIVQGLLIDLNLQSNFLTWHWGKKLARKSRALEKKLLKLFTHHHCYRRNTPSSARGTAINPPAD